MPTVTRDVVLNATNTDIYNALIDASRSKEIWGSESMTTSDDWPNVGATGEVTNKMGPISAKINLTVLENDPGQHYKQQMDGTVKGTMQVDYASENGGTKLTISMDYDVPGGLLSGAINKMVVEKQVTDTIDYTINALKNAFSG